VINASLTKSEKYLWQYRVVLRLSAIAGIWLFSRFLIAYLGLSPPTMDVSFPHGAETGRSTEWLRGEKLCTFRGKYHLAWSIPMADPSYYVPSAQIHAFMMYAPFLALYEKRGMLVQGGFLLLTGPVMAAVITPNLMEQASIWCFFSIMQIVAMLFLIRETLVLHWGRDTHRASLFAKKPELKEKAEAKAKEAEEKALMEELEAEEKAAKATAEANANATEAKAETKAEAKAETETKAEAKAETPKAEAQKVEAPKTAKAMPKTMPKTMPKGATTPTAAMEAMGKILSVCMTRTELREACEAAAPRRSDVPWGHKDEKQLGKASEALSAAKSCLVEATQALRDKTANSANLLDSADDIGSYRERKERWNKEVDSLASQVEEAAGEEGKCRRAVDKLKQRKARAAAAADREAAIKSEAEALALRKKISDAVKAIELLEEDVDEDEPESRVV